MRCLLRARTLQRSTKRRIVPSKVVQTTVRRLRCTKSPFGDSGDPDASKFDADDFNVDDYDDMEDETGLSHPGGVPPPPELNEAWARIPEVEDPVKRKKLLEDILDLSKDNKELIGDKDINPDDIVPSGDENDFERTKEDLEAIEILHGSLGIVNLTLKTRNVQDKLEYGAKALALLDTAWHCYPHDKIRTIILYMQGSIEMTLRHYDEAYKYMMQCVEYDPGFVPGLRGVGEALHYMDKFQAAQVYYGDYLDKFISYFKDNGTLSRVLTSDEVLSDILLKMATCSVNANDHTLGGIYIDAVIKLDHPKFTPMAYMCKGKIAMINGKFWEQIKYNTIAIEQDPTLVHAWQDRCDAWMAVGRDDKAHEDRRRASILIRKKIWEDKAGEINKPKIKDQITEFTSMPK